MTRRIKQFIKKYDMLTCWLACVAVGLLVFFITSNILVSIAAVVVIIVVAIAKSATVIDGVIYNNILPFGDYMAMCICGVIFARNTYYPNGELELIGEITLNHEKIHTRQWWEMLVVLFAVWYLLERLVRIIIYLIRYRKKLNKSRMQTILKNSYKRIAFEKEARLNQNNLDYRKNRKLFSWIKYL